MHKFVRALDNPPPIQEQTSQVSRFWGQSHGLTMRHKNLTVNRFTSRWNTLFEYFHFCLEKLIFMCQLCRNPQFSGIFISIRHIWSSFWQDKIMPNKVIVTSLLHLDTFRIRCQNGARRWKFIRRRQSSKLNGKVRILLNVFLAINFPFHVFLTPGFSSFWRHR